MKKLLIKEVDRYYSKNKKDKYISEYLIYVKIDDLNLTCETAIGDNEKKDIIHELVLKHFYDYNKQEILNLIEEITLFNKN
jgi:hypothetical protein